MVFAVGGVSQVYNVTNGRSPLRRLAVDRAIYESSVQYFKEDLADWDVDFVRELAAQLLTKRDKRIAAENAPYKHSICRTYHEHKEGALDCLGKVVEKKKGETGSS